MYKNINESEKLKLLQQWEKTLLGAVKEGVYSLEECMKDVR